MKILNEIDKENGHEEFDSPNLKNALPDKVLSETTDLFSSKEKTIPYGSQVLLKNDIMKTILAYVMNITQMDGRNLYHVRTSGQTSIFV